MSSLTTSPTRLLTRTLPAATLRAAVLMVLVFVVFTISTPNFFTQFNILQVLAFAVPAGMVAIGQTFVLAAGEIDLSVGAMSVLAGIVLVELEPHGMPIAYAGALGVGLGVGLMNGILTAFGITSFIASLAGLLVAQGLAFALASAPVSGMRLDLAVSISSPVFWLLTPQLVIGLIVLIVAQVGLVMTVWGRSVLARGSQPRAARLLALRTHSVVIGCFVLSGLLSAGSGIIYAIGLNAGSPVIGGNLLLLSIAAALLGGASLTGGTGSILGTSFALIALLVLGNGMDLQHITSYVQQIVQGTVVLVAVVFPSVSHSVRSLKRLSLSMIWPTRR